ncbi:toprim domain-containing protein [Aquimarina sp. RZ0]|uniref:toprim domain-containing protein n=1 Tax=Aquimarina sp. RZ0 TaxID=2607730 RepID=UPI0011F38A94|nr:toprim domain-containing protein [Aquimarina sp. RZ0]KAA1241438.1 hypothetical protein F0000_26590 [Aquimarina sp. RZ0]
MQIHDIKQQLSIHQVLQHYGIEIKNNHVHCPFHNDTTPSMRVYGDTGSVFCFSGNCDHGNKVIDVIDFIMLKENCSKHQAINQAKELLGYKNTQNIADTYHILQTQLPRSKKALQYLESRGLKGIGDVGSNHRNGGNQIAYQLPHLKNCIVFPLRNHKNQIVSLYGRSYTSTVKGCHYYLQNRQGMYPAYPDPTAEHLILTESVIDAATLQLHGKLLPNTTVLACYGTNGFTKEHAGAINQINQLQDIVLFFDGDTAGRTAAAKLQTQLQQQYPKLTIKTVTTPVDEDINSLWVNHEDAGIFHTLLSEAIETPSFSIEDTTEITPQAEKTTSITSSEKQNEPQNTDHQESELLLKVKGNIKNTGDSLKVTLQSQNPVTGQIIIQKVDLYDYTALEKHAKVAAKALDIDMAIILQEWQVYGLTLEKQHHQKQEATIFKVDQAVKNQCLEFLKSPDLLNRINQAIQQTGVVGETDNRLLLFLIASSYHDKKPLHGLIQGSSGSGKTKLLQSIYKLMPREAYKSFTRVTESSFYNYKEDALCHKLLCFEDVDGLKEEALLALRELQSNGWLNSSVSQKVETGTADSVEKLVNGPIASLACTTRADLYEDNISRCFVIAVDESASQTSRIIAYQNKLAAGQIDLHQIKTTQTFIQNCLRVLEKSTVINPYATQIQLPQNIHKLRRLHSMYQHLVAQITWLHQYQRKRNPKGYLITEKQDLQLACDILFETIILKVDELHGSLRQFYECLKNGIADKGGEEYVFTRFDIKQITGVSKTQTHRYLQQLVELEYIQQFGYANRGFKYKIVYWDNHTALRTKIKNELQQQINTI